MTLQTMQADFAASILADIPAGDIEANWTQITWSPPASCNLSLYISAVWYDQCELKELCDATAGCSFDPAAYSEFALALKIFDETTDANGGSCYASSKKSFGFYWITTHIDMPAFHLVFDQGILDKFLNCEDFYAGGFSTCNGSPAAWNYTGLYDCTD